MRTRLLFPLLALPAAAQVSSGTLTGLVLDASSSPILNARVIITETARGLRRDASSNETGQFRLPSLPVGLYRLNVSSPGFSSFRRENLEVASGQSIHLDIRLQPAAVQESITVSAEIDQLDQVRNSSARATTFTTTDLTKVPVISGGTSRNYSTQVYLMPGTAPGRSAHAPFSFNGMRPTSTVNVMVDGADFNNPNTGALSGAGFNEMPVSMEVLTGVEVQNNNYKAEFGRAAGGTINLVSQSGTNQWHGKFYNFFRNSAMDARNTMLRQREQLKRNQFGGVLSGPVIKDKLFVLASGEWLLNRFTGISSPRATFTEAERQTAAPAVRPLIELYPVANVPGSNLFDFGGIYTRTTFRSLFFRADYAVSDKHLLSARWNDTNTLANNTGLIFGQGQQVDTTNGSTVVSLNSALSPTVVNEARAYYTNRYSNTIPFTPLLGDRAVNDSIGLLNVAGAERLGSIFRNYLMIHNYQFSNDLSVQRGRHGLKFGGIYRAVQVNTTENGNTDGTLTFDSRQAFLAAQPRTYTRVLGGTRLDQRSKEAGLYAQTDFRFRRNLNVNLGMRWELYTPGTDIYNRVPVNYRTDYNNFAPRAGFSWTPGQQTSLVIRGGYGLFTTPLALRYLGNLRFQPERILSLTAINPRFPNLLGGAVTQSSEQTRTSPDLVQPYSQQINFTVDYRLPNTQTVFSVAYVGTRGVMLPLTLFPNGGERMPQNARPNPSTGLVRLLSTVGASNYHSLQATANGRFARRFQVRTAYTWSRALDDLSTDTAQSIAENNRRLDRGLADFHLAHALSSAVFYDIPAVNGAFGLLRNWTISGVMQARSGRAFSLLSGTDGIDGNRVNRIHDIDGAIARGNDGAFALRPAAGLTLAQVRAQVTPANGVTGTLGRNTERGDPFFDVSISLQRDIRITERLQGQFRAEAFNLTNTANYDAYVGSIVDPRFGQAASALQPRALQLAFRVTF